MELFAIKNQQNRLPYDGCAHYYGPIITPLEADDYFNSRPYKNRLGAWASSQSEILDQRETFTNKIKQFEKKFPN